MTSAMLTLRKTFSSSLASSAASGRGQLVDGRVDPPKQRRGPRRGGRGEAADQAWDRAAGARRVARVDTLRGKGKIEVPTSDQARPLQLSPERTGGRTRIRGRLEDNQLSGTELAPNPLGRSEDGAEVGVLRARDRRRHADEDHVTGGQVGVVAALDPQALAEARAQARIVDVVNR